MGIYGIMSGEIAGRTCFCPRGKKVGIFLIFFLWHMYHYTIDVYGGYSLRISFS